MSEPWDDFSNVGEVEVGVENGKLFLITMAPLGNVFTWNGPEGHGMDIVAFRELAQILTEGLANGVGLGRDGWEHTGVKCGSPAAQDFEQALLLMSAPEAPIC